MSLSNVGAVLNLLQGFIAAEFPAATYNTTQGLAKFPEMIRDVAMRSDLTGCPGSTSDGTWASGRTGS